MGVIGGDTIPKAKATATILTSTEAALSKGPFLLLRVSDVTGDPTLNNNLYKTYIKYIKISSVEICIVVVIGFTAEFFWDFYPSSIVFIK